MNIDVQTQANNGHLILYVLDSKNNKLIELRDSTSGSCMLVPGKTYRFEWHVWSSNSADYTIDAKVIPNNNSFPPLHWGPPQSSFTGPHQDMGGFYFTI
jgi:hypothetical protein